MISNKIEQNEVEKTNTDLRNVLFWNASGVARERVSQSASSLQITLSLAAFDPAFQLGLICLFMRVSLISYSVWYHFPSSNKRKTWRLFLILSLLSFGTSGHFHLVYGFAFFSTFFFSDIPMNEVFNVMEEILLSGWDGTFWYSGTLSHKLIHS